MLKDANRDLDGSGSDDDQEPGRNPNDDENSKDSKPHDDTKGNDTKGNDTIQSKASDNASPDIRPPNCPAPGNSHSADSTPPVNAATATEPGAEQAAPTEGQSPSLDTTQLRTTEDQGTAKPNEQTPDGKDIMEDNVRDVLTKSDAPAANNGLTLDSLKVSDSKPDEQDKIDPPDSKLYVCVSWNNGEECGPSKDPDTCP